jgi:sorbitol/mannitol transport system substrate-binding protein
MKKNLAALLFTAVLATGLILAGCSKKKEAAAPAGTTPAATTAAAPASGEVVEVNIALANNQLSQAFARIAQTEFAKSNLAQGVKVNISVLPENDLRNRLTTEASTGGTTYDIYYIGPYEAQTWAKNGWIEDLKPYFDKMPADQKAWYDYGDLIKGMMDSVSLNGDPYGIPFYGESSFLMYNKDLFAKAGITMPEHPTWDQVYDFAKKIKALGPDYVGITMRGAPGWGMSGAPFIPIVNTYGGKFYDMNWNATVDTPQQRAAWKMYHDILNDAGQKDILSYTYNECVGLMSQGKCGMYYDATSQAPALEGKESKIAGKVGYVFAPHEVQDKNTGWLWNWTMCLNPKTTQAKKDAAFKFMLWATSKDFVDLTMKIDPSGASTPSCNRSSTFQRPDYSKIPYAKQTLATLQDLDFNHPCIDPTPYHGLQYIAIPEFANAGDLMTRNLADYTVNKISLDEAITKTQKVFEQVAIDGNYKK